MESDYEYYIEADLDQYAGKWVAIFKKKVIASSDSFKELLHLVETGYPNAKPLFSRIPEKMAQIL